MPAWSTGRLACQKALEETAVESPPTRFAQTTRAIEATKTSLTRMTSMTTRRTEQCPADKEALRERSNSIHHQPRFSKIFYGFLSFFLGFHGFS